MLDTTFRTRLGATLVAIAVCSGCGSTNPAPTPSSTSAVAGPDCAVHANGPSSIDGVFADIPASTVKRTCPADVDPDFAGPQFDAQFSADSAGDVAQDGTVVLKVFAGQLKSGRGDDFVHQFLTALSTAAAPDKTVASEAMDVGGHQVTHFNVPVAAEGYAYAAGPTVVIAYDVAGGSHAETAQEVFAKLLDGLH